MEGSVVPNNRGRPRSPPLHRGVLNFSPKLWPRQTAARLNRLQQQEAHQTQLAEVARKQKAAADAYAIAEAAKQAAAENTLHIEVERTEIETAIKDLQQKAETIRREEQKANAKLNRLNKNNKEQKPKERDLGAAEAYFGTAAEDPIDGLLIKTAHTAPKSRCSSENCDDPSCPSSQNFCQAFMEWLEQRFGDEHADGPSSMRRTYDNDEAMAFAAIQKQLDNEPKLLDYMVLDSCSNIHLITLNDARRLFKSRRRTNMTVTGIGGRNAERRII